MSYSYQMLRLQKASLAYLAQRYSVIPVWGDAKPDQSKQASIPWTAYQKRLPSEYEVSEWFSNPDYQGLAIVTGRVSSLVVIDFDEEALAEEFVTMFPDLAETRIVYSAGRQLPHFYYHIQPTQDVPSRRVKGIDLQSDGCYVLAPPTTLNDKAYRSNGKFPKALTNTHIRQILAFMELQRLRQTTPLPELLVNNANNSSEAILPSRLSPKQAVAYYRYHAPNIGRNNALFQTSLRLRDAGWEEEAVKTVLVPVHIKQPKRDEPAEPRQQREREAMATINSAFSRPPRRTTTERGFALSNSIREKLLRYELVCVARLLDVLTRHSAPVGTVYTEGELLKLAKNQVGRFSVRNALNATFPDGTPIFERENPFPRPQTLTNVALSDEDDEFNSCYSFGVSSSNKKRGRPPVRFHIPTAQQIALKLRITLTKGDELEENDLKSPCAYRMGLHREFVKRLSGDFTVKFFANRLNVTRRTCQRYNKQPKLNVMAQYDESVITWQNVDCLKVDVPHQGCFLQDKNGKRYAVSLSTGKMLLAKRLQPVFMRQRENYYWHSDGRYDVLRVMGIRPQTPQNAPERLEEGDYDKGHYDARENAVGGLLGASNGVQQSWQESLNKDTTATNAQMPNYPAQTKTVTSQNRDKPTPHSKRFYHKPLAETAQERLALALKEAFPLRLTNARQLVHLYGIALVSEAMRAVRMRQNVNSPCGFLISWLRSESKIRGWVCEKTLITTN